MSSISSCPQQTSSWRRIGLQLKQNLNFYRIHVLFFTFTPLIFAGVFYASNGKFHVAFIDALFLCVSSITVTGLATIDLSATTPWQQVILFLLMCLGSPITVSWFIVYVRRYYFSLKLEHIIESKIASHATTVSPEDTRWYTRFLPWYRMKLYASEKDDSTISQSSARYTRRGARNSKVRPDMIRRVAGAPRRVDPSGLIRNGGDDSDTVKVDSKSSEDNGPLPSSMSSDNIEGGSNLVEGPISLAEPSQVTTPDQPHTISSQTGQDILSRTDDDHEKQSNIFTGQQRGREYNLPRTQTVEFVQSDLERLRGHEHNSGHMQRVASRGSAKERSPSEMLNKRGSIHGERNEYGVSKRTATMEDLHSDNNWHHNFPARIATMQSHHHSIRPAKFSAREEDFGGFPSLHIVIARLIRRFFPNLQQRLARTLTIPHSITVHSQRGSTIIHGAKMVPYISFDAIVGHNSTFRALTNENLEELGGVEYRALNMLLWIVGLYHIGVPLAAFVVIAPYISQARWRHVFSPPEQHRFISPVWYSLFQVVSAYTNSGTSLVDQSMVPFQRAYAEVLTLPFVILAGNTAFPVFLRLIIWICSKIANKRSRAYETLHFLLDHPRRCFIYLFPSHQTWFLLTVLVLLNFTDWFFFLVLDIGNPAINSVPLGTRFAVGLLQATAVRSSGFAAIPLSALAPAVKVLYVVMMYVSVYPIAMSVRSTNVYEERSLGVFNDHLDEDQEEALIAGNPSRARIWGKYLAAHARKQLSFDMWWLAFALFVVCIIEKKSLEDESNSTWFNIFSIIFELTSAYGTVGLSLGTPNNNYSFSGALRPLSKLILCAVMLRGRHRGLPVAIDRAILLPVEFKKLFEPSRDTESDMIQRTGLTNSPIVESPHERMYRRFDAGKNEAETENNVIAEEHASDATGRATQHGYNRKNEE